MRKILPRSLLARNLTRKIRIYRMNRNNLRGKRRIQKVHLNTKRTRNETFCPHYTSFCVRIVFFLNYLGRCTPPIRIGGLLPIKNAESRMLAASGCAYFSDTIITFSYGLQFERQLYFTEIPCVCQLQRSERPTIPYSLLTIHFISIASKVCGNIFDANFRHHCLESSASIPRIFRYEKKFDHSP